jgi:hypothetical protein
MRRRCKGWSKRIGADKTEQPRCCRRLGTSAIPPIAAEKRTSREVGVGRVEDGRGSLSPAAIAPFPIPARQTRRADLRHRAFRLASPKGTRRRKRTASVLCAVGLFPSPSTQQSRTAPVFVGVLRLIANHHDLAIFESAPEVRVLCSAGITRLHCSYDPVRLPPWPPPVATLRPLPSPPTGLPRLLEPPFRRAVPTTPADRAGACVDCFPAHTAFP